MSKTIPGTTPFDGDAAQKGYALNKMCFSFNHKANRDAFVRRNIAPASCISAVIVPFASMVPSVSKA